METGRQALNARDALYFFGKAQFFVALVALVGLFPTLRGCRTIKHMCNINVACVRAHAREEQK